MNTGELLNRCYYKYLFYYLQLKESINRNQKFIKDISSFKKF